MVRLLCRGRRGGRGLRWLAAGFAGEVLDVRSAVHDHRLQRYGTTGEAVHLQHELHRNTGVCNLRHTRRRHTKVHRQGCRSTAPLIDPVSKAFHTKSLADS